MLGATPPVPDRPSWRGAQLKPGDKFIFYVMGKRMSERCEERR
jgi:hypothetical protein